MPIADSLRRNRSLARAAVLVAVALIAIAAAAWLAGFVRLPEMFTSVAAMEAAIQSWGAAAPLASTGLMVIHSFVPFPAEMLAIANGMLFGLGLGVAVTWAGAMLGGLLAFGLARWLGQPFVQRVAGPERWRRIEGWTEGYGARALLLARLTPVVSFNLVNYAAGLAGVGWWTFTWTTAIGILPITFASVLVGSHMAVIPWPLWAVIALAITTLAVLHWRMSKGTRAKGS